MLSADRVGLNGLKQPTCIWITGLSAAGKTTLAKAIHARLQRLDIASTVLDGDDLRAGLCRDIGFSLNDRSENIRRVAEVARLFVGAGLIPIVSLISPRAVDRQAARALFPTRQFVEVFLDTPFEVCEERDPKGLYKRARSGDLNSFTGISSIYEAPDEPDIHLSYDGSRPSAQAKQVLSAPVLGHLFR